MIVRNPPWGYSERAFHAVNFVYGAICFIIGSICYYVPLDWDTAGGILYSIGSFGFMTADLFEWYFYRVGCCCDDEVRDRFEADNKFSNPDRTTLAGFLERATPGMNQFLSFLGSFQYLIGSIYFIPQLDHEVLGTWLFITGSGFIVVSQVLKFLIGLPDLPSKILELNSGLGAFCFLVGSIIFLPMHNTSYVTEDVAATWFVVGSFNFFITAVTITYRHFCYSGNPLPDNAKDETMDEKALLNASKN